LHEESSYHPGKIDIEQETTRKTRVTLKWKVDEPLMTPAYSRVVLMAKERIVMARTETHLTVVVKLVWGCQLTVDVMGCWENDKSKTTTLLG
jgi:hypothetical protein